MFQEAETTKGNFSNKLKFVKEKESSENSRTDKYNWN